MRIRRMVRLMAFIAVAGIFVSTRFWNLTVSCLWFDEIFSVHAAEHSWNSILNFIALDLIHPPLFYIVLKFWITAGGESIFWLRCLPVAFSLLAIVPFLLLCRELKTGFWAGTLALSFIAVNGSLIKYAQEVRMYSMLMCFSLFSMWLFTRYFQTGKGIVALMLINIVLVYTHYFGWLVILSEVVAILALQRIKWRPILVMTIVTAACFIPWLINVVYAAESGSDLSQNIGWMQRPGTLSLAHLLLNLVEPFYYPSTSIDPASVYRISIPLLLISLASITLYVLKLKGLERMRSTIQFLLPIFVGVPVACAFIASWVLPVSIWGTRHLIVVFAPASILIALSIRNISDRRITVGAVTLFVLFSSYAFVLSYQQPRPTFIWCAWDELAQQWQLRPFLEADSTKLYVFEDLVAYHFWFEVHNNPNYKITKVNAFLGVAEDKAYFLPRGFDQISTVQVGDAFNEDSFWIAFRDTDPSAETPGLSMVSYTPPIIGYFLALGFDTQDVMKMNAGGETAYLVKLVRRGPQN